MADELEGVAARRAAVQDEWRGALRDEHRRLIDTLRERRIALGMTQEQVADRVGVSRTQIANAEVGTRLTSVETLIAYAITVGARLTIEDR